MLIAAMMATITLTSCDMEFSNSSDDRNPEEYRAQVANTRWQLTEVTNQNNEWVAPEFYTGFDIPLLSFSYDNSYFMRICTSTDRADVSLINGTYSIDSNFSITMTDCKYSPMKFFKDNRGPKMNTLSIGFYW